MREKCFRGLLSGRPTAVEINEGCFVGLQRWKCERWEVDPRFRCWGRHGSEFADMTDYSRDFARAGIGYGGRDNICTFVAYWNEYFSKTGR